MKRAIPVLILSILLPAWAGPPTSPVIRLLWTFGGPANPEYEWTTLTAAGGGLAYTVVKGPSWTYGTENGTFIETGSTIAALDLATGNVRWRADSRWPVLSPLLWSGGKVVAHNGYGELLCFDAARGKAAWKIGRELHPGSWDERTMPSARGDVFFLREENEIVCRSLKDGQPVWRTLVEAVQNKRVFPALAGECLVVANSMDAVFGLSAADGRLLWKSERGGVSELSAATPGSALVADSARTYSLAAADGRELWSYGSPPMSFQFDAKEMAKQDSRQLHEPIWNLENPQPLAFKGERVFLLHKRVMYPEGRLFSREIVCLDAASGRDDRWTAPVTGDFQGLSVAGPYLLIVQGGTVRALDAETGKTAWEFEIAGEKKLQGQPLAVDGKVLVVGAKGLYCLETGDRRITGWSQSGGSSLRSSAAR